MKKLRIIIFILLQATMFCFASEKKKVVLSQVVLSKEDDAWLGDLINHISCKPQVDIASHISITMFHSSVKDDFHSGVKDDFHSGVKDDFRTHLQKNINHAKNWIHYFNKQKKLHAENQWEFFRELGHSASCIKILAGGDRDIESRVFLELLHLGMDIESFSSSHNNNIFPCVIKEFSKNLNIMNNFIYYYKPPFDCFVMNEKKQQPCLSLIINETKKFLGIQERLRSIFSPTLYELTDDKVIRKSYKDVQDVVCKKRAAEVFLLGLKVNKIKIPKFVRDTHIFKDHIFDESVQNFSSRYKSAIEFNNYCSHVEEEISKQIEWIQKNDPKCYQELLALIPFLKTPEAFKEWYEGLKFPQEDLHN